MDLYTLILTTHANILDGLDLVSFLAYKFVINSCVISLFQALLCNM